MTDTITKPMQGLAAYLRHASRDVHVGSKSRKTLLDWAREVEAALAAPPKGLFVDMIAEHGPEFVAEMAAIGEPQPTIQSDQDVIENLMTALQWYANGEHFCKCDPNAWDTVSGEPQNWWCDEAGTATIEDGSLAKMVLSGEITGAQLQAMEDGEVFEQTPEPQPVKQAPIESFKELDYKVGWQRYEKVRKLNVHQFSELFRRGLKGERFDDMVDGLGAKP